MNDIALMIKSHLPDRLYVERLLASLAQFNVESLPAYLVVPRSQLDSFSALEESGVQLLSDEDVAGQYLVTEGAHGLSAGYLNQEIVKLAFGESGLAANYFCVDSDAVFIREFGSADFLRRPGEPYSVLVQDKELQVEPRYYREHWRGREASIRRIMELVGLDDPIVRTCHGHQIFSSRVLESFRDGFLTPRDWTYADAVREVPYEFTWYNTWLQKSKVIPIHQVEPLVKVFHDEDQHVASIARGVGIEDLARSYLAVVVNSNYSRDLGPVSAEADKLSLMGQYLSYSELARVLREKGAETFRRRLGR